MRYSRWRSEYTCDWCAEVARTQAKVLTVNRRGWQVLWRICGVCLDRLFDLRGKETYAKLHHQ